MKRLIALARGREAIAAVSSAALFAVAFPPFPLLLPAFICLVPMALVVTRGADNDGSLRAAAWTGFGCGFIGYAFNLYWIAIALSIYTKLAILGYVASLFVVAPVVAGAGAALFVARRRTGLPLAILLPMVWVASEVLFNYMSDLAFPWLPLGLATVPHPVLAQLADVSGVRGLSFWIALTNGLIADAVLLRADRRAVLLRGLAVASAAIMVGSYGAWRVKTTVLRSVAPVAIVQPNVPQEERWQEENRDRIIGILAALTRDLLAKGDASLIVWPEAALPGDVANNPSWGDTVRVLARDTPLLYGVLDLEFRSATDYEYYNAAMLADTAGSINSQGSYRKAYLVPVVERVPFVNPRWFADLKYFGGFGRGGPPETYELPFGKVGVLICYESIFPQRSRAYRREGADILINITNDAWFDRTIAAYQHAAHLPLRAIENRVGIVRAANTGISGYIDPLGRVRDATQLFTTVTRTYTAETTDVTTFYVRFGDWVGTLCAAATVMLLLFDAVERRRIKR